MQIYKVGIKFLNVIPTAVYSIVTLGLFIVACFLNQIKCIIHDRMESLLISITNRANCVH